MIQFKDNPSLAEILEYLEVVKSKMKCNPYHLNELTINGNPNENNESIGRSNPLCLNESGHIITPKCNNEFYSSNNPIFINELGSISNPKCDNESKKISNPTGTSEFSGKSNPLSINGEKRMKVIVAGSRSITDYKIVDEAIKSSGFEVSEVVSGCAPGVDRLGQTWAKNHDIHVVAKPANWELHGKAAGIIRNREMAEYAEALVAVWDGNSRGTKNMIEEAQKRELQVYVYKVSGDAL